MSAREELLTLTVAEVRRIPIVAAALDDAAREAEAAGDTKIVPRDASATAEDVTRWARGAFAALVYGEPTVPSGAVALYNLLAVLGCDVPALWVGSKGEMLKRHLLEESSAQLVRRAREGGAA